MVVINLLSSWIIRFARDKCHLVERWIGRANYAKHVLSVGATTLLSPDHSQCHKWIAKPVATNDSNSDKMLLSFSPRVKFIFRQNLKWARKCLVVCISRMEFKECIMNTISLSRSGWYCWRKRLLHKLSTGNSYPFWSVWWSSAKLAARFTSSRQKRLLTMNATS